MGAAKQMKMERDGEIDRVVSLLCRGGAISECPVHEGVYTDNFDEAAVEEVETKLAKRMSAADAKSLISDAMAMAGDECGSCAKNNDS